MTAFHRWCIVTLGVVLLIGVPFAIRQLPAHDEDISATDLLARIEASRNHPYSGYVESQGNLQLPITDRFTESGHSSGSRPGCGSGGGTRRSGAWTSCSWPGRPI